MSFDPSVVSRGFCSVTVVFARYSHIHAVFHTIKNRQQRAEGVLLTIAPDKRALHIMFSYFFIKIYIVGTYNIWFSGEIRTMSILFG